VAFVAEATAKRLVLFYRTDCCKCERKELEARLIRKYILRKGAVCLGNGEHSITNSAHGPSEETQLWNAT
jgi:hypothetical protein